MSVISRVEVVNLLNHKKESAEWNPWYRHEVIVFDGHSGVLQMPNGKGKTTIAEGIAALISRNPHRLGVIQGRMAFRGQQMSHFRIELLKGSRSDLVGIGGDPWVLGMAGNSQGPITFYTYHGRLEDVPVVKKLTGEELVCASLEEIERAVNAKPFGDRKWNAADESEWRNHLVGGRHLPKAAIEEIARLQGMGGAEKAVRFFDIKPKGSERFDVAFFFHQIAPDLMDDLMTSEGEEEERRAAARSGRRYQPDRTFDKMVVNTVRSVTEAKYAIDRGAVKIDKWKKVAAALNDACELAKQVKERECQVDDIRAELAANVATWRWLTRNMPGWPQAKPPGALLGQLCAHIGILPQGAVVVRDSGMAFLLGKDVHHANEFLVVKKGIAPLREPDRPQVIEIAIDNQLGRIGEKSGADTRKWYPVNEAVRGMRAASSYDHGLNAETAAALIESAAEWARNAYFHAHPVAARVAQFSVELGVKRSSQLEYRTQLSDRQKKAQEQLIITSKKISEIESSLEEPRRQLSDLEVFRRRFPEDDPRSSAKNLWERLESLIENKKELERRRNDISTRLANLDEKQIVPGQQSLAVHDKLREANLPFATVYQILQAERSLLQKTGRWHPVARIFANLLFAPVVDTAEAGHAASLVLDRTGLSAPVFLRAELLKLIHDGEIMDLPELRYTHTVWGGADTATVQAFINPEETHALRQQLLEQLDDAEAALDDLEDQNVLKEDYQQAALAAKAVASGAETLIEAKTAELATLEAECRANEKRAKAIDSILAKDQIELKADLADLYPLARGFWDKTQAIEDLTAKHKPWVMAADELHALVGEAQRQYIRVLRIERDFGLSPISIDGSGEPAVISAVALKEAVNQCLGTGASITAAIGTFRASVEGLDFADLRVRLNEANGAVQTAKESMKFAVAAAFEGDTEITDFQKNALKKEASTPDGLIAVAARFEKETEEEDALNTRTRKDADELEGRAIDFLVNMVSEVRARKRILEAALSEGEGAQFIVDCTFPDKDGLRDVFTSLMEVVRRIDRETRATLGEGASDDQVRMIADRRLRGEIREKTKRQILLKPSVKVKHSAISRGDAVHLQDPDTNNPDRFSGGENTAISLAWIIRRAKYAVEKAALKGRHTTSIESSFIILDGLFSDLSDKDLTREAMAPLKAMGGQFQIVALVHPPEYLLKHDPTIFPVLNVGLSHGDGWKMLHFDADKWKDFRVVKEGSIGITHLSILPTRRQGNRPNGQGNVA